MKIRATCSTRHDHVVASAGDILPLLEKGETLSLQFFAGRSALKAWLVGRCPTLERNFIEVFDTFSFRDDDGMKDHHRNPARYAELMKQLGKKNPSVVVDGWKLQGFFSLISAILEIKVCERYRGLRYREKFYEKNGQSLNALATIWKYIGACRGN
ncbi:MAG: hypothetical protein A3D65_02905 [Candidatus Lloydbacteria bacterium RIFCSPHIGHO2_02_FULL_50_13]|uniref:Uncharacterized protein n=1 Tax=Candidatus Lloydbacteria bacterium RIFCSPHIGHO2_02_FULL_50_13 TaxID=1798661 RepID=A0A1G2D2Q8_9BACT|nr:MAG: hypothetical protein A3D65_02905 [Candidatus Lloydbacteria bacterium RIFCSPHIGHO2_02_FULL_50_13]